MHWSGRGRLRLSTRTAEVEAYLQDQNRIFEQIKAQYPMPQEMIDRLELAKKDAAPRVA
ncbi:MAG TPA: hypothetical protein VIN93_11170 [Bryobacteraceae bacterium]